MDLELTGLSALVTGASKGIGRAVALTLAGEGCQLHIAARGRKGLDALADEIVACGMARPTVHAVDLSSATAVVELPDACGDLDIVVNNAGSIPPGSLDSVDESEWRRAWDLKVFGTIGLCRLSLAMMRRRRKGVLVNIIGLAGERPSADYIVGSSGNAALMAFTRAVGAQSIDHGVRVVGVNPGLVATERMEQLLRDRAERRFGDNNRWRDCLDTANLPSGRPAEPLEIANVVAFLASSKASYISGTVVTVDGGRSYRV